MSLTKPVNLYLLSRITDESAYQRVERHASGKDEPKRTQIHEIISLRQLVDAFLRYGISVNMLDGFFLSFQIPQIGKEFDLLKFTESRCLNIEIKSQAVPNGDIHKQLIKNKHYLAHLGKDTDFYSVITDSLVTYRLTENNELQQIDFSDVVKTVMEFEVEYLTQIDNMFRTSDYLVSPLNTPEKFINGEYFLTQAQEQIKKNILSDIFVLGCSGFYSIIGKPGTGKTLLTYDIAKELSKTQPTLVIHCGKTSDGQQKLKQEIENFNVIAAGYLKYHPEILNDYHFILVDESHRFHPHQFDILCNTVKRNKQICVFSSDPEQVLSNSEERNNIANKILSLHLLGKYELSEKIRTNKELASFITSVRNLNRKPKVPMDYNNISLAYANSVDEAQQIIEYYRHQDYIFINYSKSNYNYSPYAQYEEDFDTHHVIGQEFDNVLMLMDSSFFYDENGILQGVSHPNPDYLYPNLFYQGITRVREKIALVVVGAPRLFEKISSIL